MSRGASAGRTARAILGLALLLGAVVTTSTTAAASDIPGVRDVVFLDASAHGFLDPSFVGTTGSNWTGDPNNVVLRLTNNLPLVATFRTFGTGGAQIRLGAHPDLFARSGMIGPNATLDLVASLPSAGGGVLVSADVFSREAIFVNFFGRAVASRVVSIDELVAAEHLLETEPGKLFAGILAGAARDFAIHHSKTRALAVLSKGLIRFGVSREHRVWLFKALRQFGKRLAKLGPGWVAEIGTQVGAYLAIATAQIGATGSVRLIRKLDLSFDASGFQASACGGGSPIVDVTYRFRNSVDTASLDRAHPRYWAYDSGAARYRVWKVGDERFCQISDLTGTFTAVSGSSPNGSGSISAGITGSFRGGTRATFSGTFDPGIATSGDLGTFDSSCEISDDRAAATCDGDGGFATDFFPERRDWTPVWEVWLYNGGAHGTWLQTTAGNAGDILG